MQVDRLEDYVKSDPTVFEAVLFLSTISIGLVQRYLPAPER